MEFDYIICGGGSAGSSDSAPAAANDTGTKGAAVYQGPITGFGSVIVNGVRFGESLDRDMVAIPLGPPQRFVVVGSPAYLKQAGRPSDPRELNRHRCIRIRFPSGARYRWEFEKAGEKLEVDVAGPLEVGEMPLMLRAAEDGLGLAYVYAETARASLSAGRLETVLDDWRPPEAGFFLYYPSRRLPVFGRNGVATSHPLAAQAGLQMLRQGGSAVDAAVAAAAVMTVVEPCSNGLGSDAFALVWDGGQLQGLNASGRAPLSPAKPNTMPAKARATPARCRQRSCSPATKQCSPSTVRHGAV